MAKNLKIDIKNLQIAKAVNLKEIKEKLAKKEKPKKAPTKKSEVSPLSSKPRARLLPPEEKSLPQVEEKVPVAVVKKAIAKKKKTKEKIPAEKEEKAPLPPEKEEKVPIPQKEEIPTAVTPVIPEKLLEEEKPKKKVKELKPYKKHAIKRTFDSRDRLGLREGEDEIWRKARRGKPRRIKEEIISVRPSHIKIKLPISLKDLAAEMKIKASELIAKLFSQGIIITLNDLLEDETTVQLLGSDFGCEITIDTSQEKRLRITEQTITEEILKTSKESLVQRPPIITFMGHVDHGKTSLIDAIRKSNIVAQEAGAITQHIGAFSVPTSLGTITILDTPGHEAFSSMRERGANVTDITVLVIAGDEGMKPQTLEAIHVAKAANIHIVVAINKCDKPDFDAEKVYRQLADQELLPEIWGGTTITVNCSAVTKKGIEELLEMLSLQAEMLELKANPTMRARGTVLESEMHKGLGAIATILVRNGTLHLGDAIVFGSEWGRIKTMMNQYGQAIETAGPSTPVKVTGLSGLAEAGDEFVVVKDDKEAKYLANARAEGYKRKAIKQKTLIEQFQPEAEKKVLNVILRADMQGSLEALKQSLAKIQSDKVRIHFINEEVGEISESDITLAAAAKATIIGFHTGIETHAEGLIKQLKVTVRIHDIIYHAIDDVKNLMLELLEMIEEEEDVASALVTHVFKSSQYGNIAGCIVRDGTIKRVHNVRLVRNQEVLWKGKIASLRRLKEDVKEVSKDVECGIVLEHFSDVQPGDILQTYEIKYRKQEL